MKNNTIEDIKEYAKDSQTSEEPTEQNYAEGVKVGWTLPAKWWNWLMNAFTKRFRETKATVDSMYEELSNLMWPLVPGENETNDQCSHRIYGSLSELSEQIGTNTENISKNAAAINTEKLARQNAIEQEQISRTQQDNVLDSKISSLYSTVNTNTESISANTEAINALSNTVNTNTENISKNATAINTEKLARQNAIEQEQTSRTSQDNVLDSKISSLYSTVNTNTENISKNATAISALSNTVNTNTENISKNASAINTEKLARQNAIEQEQTSRTSQDEFLNRKINSLYTLITQTQTEIYNSIITHNIYRTDEVDWTTLFNDLKTKGCPTGLHIGDIVYTVNSYDGHYCAFLVVDINYFKGLVRTIVRITSSQYYTKPLDYNHIVLLSLGNKLTAYASSDVGTYPESTVYKNLNGPFCTAIRSEILSSYSDAIYSARILSNGSVGDSRQLPGNSCNASLCQLVGPEVQLMIPSNSSFSPADSKRIHYNDFQRQFKLFKEKGFLEYGYRIFDVPVNLGATPQRLTSANIGVLDIASNTDVFAIFLSGDNSNLPSGVKPALSTFVKTIPKKGAEGTTSYFPEFFIVGDNS